MDGVEHHLMDLDYYKYTILDDPKEDLYDVRDLLRALCYVVIDQQARLHKLDLEVTELKYEMQNLSQH